MSEKDYGVPQPPDIERPWLFKTAQKLGIPLLMVIPILAILGVFGHSVTSAMESGETLSLEATYPTRFRYKTIAPLVIKVQNVSSQTVPTVTVRLEQDYLAAFSNLAFYPSVDEITEDAYYVHLADVKAGEIRIVRVEIQAEKYWEHEGAIQAAAGGVEEPPDVGLSVETFVFP